MKDKITIPLEEFIIMLKNQISEGERLLEQVNSLMFDYSSRDSYQSLNIKIQNWHESNVNSIREIFLGEYKERFPAYYDENRFDKIPNTRRIGDELRIQLKCCLDVLIRLPYDLIDDIK